MQCPYVSLEVVIDTFYQRVFRTYYHHVDVLFDTECLDGLKVIGFHVYVFTTLTRSCIAGGNKQFLTFLALSDFPGQCVLTTATAQQKYFHPFCLCFVISACKITNN